ITKLARTPLFKIRWFHNQKSFCLGLCHAGGLALRLPDVLYVFEDHPVEIATHSPHFFVSE
ncbi:TPA: hypothetical protein ACWL6U_004102, partial [Morganella morganii]